LEWNRIHKFLVYAKDIITLGENVNINTKLTNIEVLLKASTEVVLEVNTQKTKSMAVSRHKM